MTTIARIGDKLYADRKISCGVKLLNFNIEQEMCKIIKYEGRHIKLNDIKINVISGSGKFQDFAIFLSMFEDLICLIDATKEEEYILDIHEIIKLVMYNLGGKNNRLDTNIIFGGNNVINNKANYFILDLEEGNLNNFPVNSVTGSGREVVDNYKYTINQKHITEEMLPFISKYDNSTSKQFDVYDPYTEEIKSLLKNPNGKLPSKYREFGELISDGYRNKLLLN